MVRANPLKDEEMPEDEAAQADRDNDPNPDCRHGCNGDCLVSGSEVCTWQCHTFDSVQGYFQWKIRELEQKRAVADTMGQETLSREIYARKVALARLAANELVWAAGQETR